MSSKCLCVLTVLGLITVLGLLGCSGGGNGPVLPNLAGTDVEISQGMGGGGAELVAEGNRYLWGLWTMHVNADHTQVSAEPMRDAAFHLNVVGYLENPAQLIKIVDVSVSGDNTLLVDIQLIHPFKSKPEFTGRDVRGIAILPWIKEFPGTLVYDVDDEISPIYASRYLLNADGYTTVWNRWMHKQVFHPQIFGYIKGKLATPDELYIGGNLHGFKAFWTDPLQRVFESNYGNSKTYEFDFPPGPLSFAYAVDVSWEPPNLPVMNIWSDFPITANSIEPYQISVSITSNSLTKLGGSATVQFDVFDWQDATNFASVHVEAPDLFDGTLDPGAPIAYPTADSARYQVTIVNTHGNAVTAGGGSDLLIAVEDVQNSVLDTDIKNTDLTAYNILKLPVSDVPAFWRDRNGDGSYVDVSLLTPPPSSLSTGIPDLTVVSRPQAPYANFGGEPEIMLFDDTNSRFILYNRTLSSSKIKAGYPLGGSPPSWLLYPTAMDAIDTGWFGVASTNTMLIPGAGNYRVFNVVNIFNQGGIYGKSWHTGTDDGTANAYLERCRDVTAGFGNVTDDPVYSLFAYDSGTVPTRASVLKVGYPYINPSASNTIRSYVPMANSGYVDQAIYPGAPILKCGIDSNPVWQTSNPLHYGFYVVESDPGLGVSEVEGFDVNFMYLPPAPIWNLTDADIKAEFPGAYALDCEVVPSYTTGIVTQGATTADYNWLCVLMTDNSQYWLAFYDPLNPSPENPGHDIKHTIYTSNTIPIPLGGPAPKAIDVDNRYFEVYALCEDSTNQFYMSVFEFFY